MQNLQTFLDFATLQTATPSVLCGLCSPPHVCHSGLDSIRRREASAVRMPSLHYLHMHNELFNAFAVAFTGMRVPLARSRHQCNSGMQGSPLLVALFDAHEILDPVLHNWQCSNFRGCSVIWGLPVTTMRRKEPSSGMTSGKGLR